MTGFLLDTNVISELTKAKPHAVAVAWLRAADECYLSVLTIGELERGVRLLRDRDASRAAKIAEWVRQLRVDYADQILPVDLDVVGAWSARPTTRTIPVVDSLLAATAIAHGLTIATRNAADFADSGASVFDPFAAA